MMLHMASKPPGPVAAQGQARGVGARHDYVAHYIGPDHAARGDLQAFIAAAFHKSYGADLSHFCDTLIGCRDGHGQWIAALGYTLAADGPLFLEQYLDGPLEREIAARVGYAIDRRQVVEVGNLAGGHAGAARALIVSMARLLHSQGLHWAAFTATASLLNSFTRLRLKPGVLADADPRRLPDAGKHWGSYYNSQPQVMFGDIRYGYAQLA